MGGEFDAANGAVSTVGSQIELDAAGNVIVSGAFYGTADFGSVTLTSLGGKDAFVTKLDPSGNFLWSRRSGTVTTDDSSNALDIDSAGTFTR